jgi:hypothetical protein
MQLFLDNYIDGSVLADISDGDLAIIISDESHRSIILRSVRAYEKQLRRRHQQGKHTKRERVSKRVEEWKRDNSLPRGESEERRGDKDEREEERQEE